MKKTLRLGAFLQANGLHIASWRHPDTYADLGVSIERYKELAQQAEAAKFDFIFLADSMSVRERADDPNDFEAMSRGGRVVTFEPVTLFSALSTVTDRIGFIATASTSYNEPYQIARNFASLDHLSAGRAGWNVVTSSSDYEARNFGRDKHIAHSDRYRRAEEFVDVVTRLWDSWEDDAFVRDKASGRFFEPDKLHQTNFEGEFFKIQGPLNLARTPQGYPVVVQAGASEPGQELAARTAEVIFAAQHTIEDGRAFYASLKGRMAKYGRRREDLLVMPGMLVIVGETQDEADSKFETLQQLIHPEVGLQVIRNMSRGIDLSKADLDAPLPDVLPETNGSKSRQNLLHDLGKRENLTLRQLYTKFAGASGHLTVVGTAEKVADVMQEWLETEAADGFNVMPPFLPGGLTDFTRLVLPELRRRGLFRSEYEGRTLRENLGLARPANQFVKSVAE